MMRSKWIMKPAFLQAEAGLAALLLGIPVYLLTRPAESVLFLQYLPDIHFRIPFDAGGILYALPSFLHIYAFILLTASVVASSTHHLRLICLFWLVIELLFEIGQLHALALIITDHLPVSLSGSVWFEAIPNYFLQGTFDPLDIAGLLLGAMAAYVTVVFSTGHTGVNEDRA